MYRLALALAILLALTVRGDAATPSAGLADARPAPILWKATDTDSEIWMLGSIHVLPPGTRWRTETIDRIVEETPLVYFEADVRIPAAESWLRHTGDRRVTDLSYKLTPAGWRRLEKIVGDADLHLGDFYYMQPWYAKHLLTDAMATDSGARLTLGVDYTIEREARRAGKEIRYFETADDQISALAAAPEEEALADLEAFLAATESETGSYQSLLELWISGKAWRLAKELRSQIASDAVYDALLVRRNENWVGQIVELMKGKGMALIVVGAGHLVGKDGVPAMLRRKGFTVTRQ
ncbi:MAG: TraB/GumN family protein [Geminicoccaceae bacterium]|nr:TraB/GumN family protein [Geminicoccaceae bacterium]